MKRDLLTMLLAFGMAVSIPAQDAAAPAAPVGQGKSAEVVVAAQETDPAPAPTALDMMNDLLNSREDWQSTGEGRITVVEAVTWTIKNPKVSADFVNQRGERMQELLIKAKAKIIQSIFSVMSGERILTIPGNPIAKQLEKEQREMQRQLQVSWEQVLKYDAELAAAYREKKHVSTPEMLAIISEWFTKKGDSYAAKLDQDKKEAYANAKKDYERAVAQHKELLEKAEQMKGTISKELKSSLQSISAMPIFGCTVLQQAETVTEKNGKYTYQIAVIYTWSEELQHAAAEVLKGNVVKFKPGKKTIAQWLADKEKKGALATWIGPRKFIDNEGNIWFLGIAAAPVDENDGDENDKLREIAEMEAEGEVMFSLFSEAYSRRTLNKLMQTRRLDSTGEAETKVLKDFSKEQSEAFKNSISGLTPKWSKTVKHQPSGLPLQVVVYAINAGAGPNLKKIQAAATRLGIEVNTAQERERGYQGELRQQYNASKDNPDARRQGVADANAELKKPAPQPKSAVVAPQPRSTAPASGSGTLRQGATVIIDDED